MPPTSPLAQFDAMDAVHAHAPALASDFGDIAAALGMLGAPAAALIAGLAVGATHCAAMCGPFILPQVLARTGEKFPAGVRQRLWTAALVPYHVGRLATYTALGTAAGGLTGMFTDATGFRTVLAFLLLLAAGSFAVKLWTVLGRPVPHLNIAYRPPFRAFIAAIRRLAGYAAGFGQFGLGLAMGFLPCGFVYAAVAAAAGTGSALVGALTTAAFGLGTMPGLVAVGYFGAFAMRRWRGAIRFAMVPLLALNVVMLTVLAARALA